MANTTLQVMGMTCAHCEAAVTRALKGIPGVKSALVSRNANSAVVEWDDKKAPREKLVDTVNELGYHAK